MATAYLGAESAPVILPHNFAQAAAVMAQFDRAAIASAIEVMVNLLDVLDDDPDLELAGDETDGNGAEDEPCGWFSSYGDGPGCTISDPDAEHDDREIEGI